MKTVAYLVFTFFFFSCSHVEGFLLSSWRDGLLMWKTERAEWDITWVSRPSIGRSAGILVRNMTTIFVMEAVMGIFSASTKIERLNGQDWWLSRLNGPNRAREGNKFCEELAGCISYVGGGGRGDFSMARFPSEEAVIHNYFWMGGTCFQMLGREHWWELPRIIAGLNLTQASWAKWFPIWKFRLDYKGFTEKLKGEGERQ